MEIQDEKLRYPVGRFEMPATFGKPDFERAAGAIADFPRDMAQAVKGLSDSALDWRYRPNGWRIREVIHHCSDSHINAYVRFKKGLTEPEPRIAGYDEAAWARLPDDQDLPIQNALDLLHTLHSRWAYLIQKMQAADFERGYYHPEIQRVVKLSEAVLQYEWHCRHHLAHVETAKKKKF